MEVNLSPELSARVEQWKAQTGRDSDELVADAITGYFDELRHTREILESRYESLRTGKAALLDGESALATLKRRNEEQRRRS